VRREHHEMNRLSWNAATVAHNAHKTDQAGFLRGGGSTLFPEELALLGDVAGKKLVHLQCNAGQDTLSLARLGAEVVGVDISDEAIAFAEGLSADSGIPARFVRRDVYDWLEESSAGWADVVFTSYGVIGWLTDLRAWAKGIAKVLVPGGRLVVVEFHPAALMLDGSFRVAFPYASSEPIAMAEGIGDYVAAARGALSPSGHEETPEFVNPHPTMEMAWGLGDVLGAVLAAGLRIERFEEYPYSNGCALLPSLVADGERFVPPPGVPSIPLMFGLVARS
jgi:2-polyprenyl-3-methyl-5-hydroxy-6-metoxy-1,4-benzoquinol methylase